MRLRAINTPDETIKRLRKEEGEMGTREGNLLMWMWGNVALYAEFIKKEVGITLPLPFLMQHISSPDGKCIINTL